MAENTSSGLFGGLRVTIPEDGAHAGQSNWQSRYAWDIGSSEGTPVYAVANGRVITMKDYGDLPYYAENKTKRLYGIGFTVQGLNGSPNVYYAHLKNVRVQKGDEIKCGQLLGYIASSGWIKYDHVHIGIEPPATIRTVLSPTGQIKCSSATQNKPDFFSNLSGSDILSKLKQLIKKLLETKEIERENKKILETFKKFENPKTIVENYKNNKRIL